jgi:putative ABC transport system permease protein
LSEGYEDQNRFGILQKVGMTKQEIQQSVNSQILLVFFLPLAAAVLHLSFAFPMIRRILLIFDLSKIWLYLFTTVMCVVLFAVLYTLAYRVTSRTYYRIVSRMPTTQDV